MENKTIQTGEPVKKPGNSSNVKPIIFLAVISVILAVVVGLLLRQVFESRSQAELALLEKEQAVTEKMEMEEQLADLEEEYVQLSTENETLRSSLESERARIRRLRSELQGMDPVEAQKFQEEIRQLEQQLEEYRSQVQALEDEKQSLISEKSQMQATVDRATSRFDELEERNRELEEQLEKAAFLTVSEVTVQGIRERRRGDEPTDRARRTDKIQVCFTINENLVADHGNRDFYIRVIDPNNRVLSQSDANTFEYNNEEMVYSLHSQVNFRNEKQNVCAVWDQDERFDSGYYNVAIYSEGRETGYQLIELN